MEPSLPAIKIDIYQKILISLLHQTMQFDINLSKMDDIIELINLWWVITNPAPTASRT